MFGPPAGQVLVKSAAHLEPCISKQQGEPNASGTGGPDSQARPWYEQERQAQHDEPPGGASTSDSQAPTRHRDRVKFAGSDGEHADDLQAPGTANSPTPVTAAGRVSFFSFTRAKAADEGPSSPHGHQPGEASWTARALSASSKQHQPGALSRAQSHTAQGQHHQAGSAAAEAGGKQHAETPSRSQSVAASGMSATLKGLLGGASSKLLGGIMGRNSGSSKSEEAAEEQEELWFTGLEDFKPICHMLHRGRYMTAYFACANKTGQHFLLKKYDKHKMLPAEERGVRRAIAFSELLQHPNLVRMMGMWESDDTIFVVEEYVGKGDILNDCISHPDKYTEHHVAVALAKPLLEALLHLHSNNIIHRSVLPENAYMGLDDVLRLGHLQLAMDQSSDRPKSRTTLLDYMAPEMLSIRPHNEHELALLDDSSEDAYSYSSSSSSSESASDDSGQAGVQQQQQQLWEALQLEEQVPHEQLGLLGQNGPAVLQADAPARDRAVAAVAADACHQQQHQHQHQHQHSTWVQQPARLDSSRQASLEPGAELQLAADALLHCAGGPGQEAAGRDALQGRRSRRSPSRALLGPCGGSGRAAWEYQDHYDEKVDIWQLGCMLHELLCGSMPFELDSKLESAGLALWADVEVLPGSVPPDCADFLQQTLTKDPRRRPSAQQLLQHPWLARCQAGEPWRDPLELEAARREAELATVSGWIRHHWATAASALGSIWQHWQRGGRVAPAEPNSSAQAQHEEPSASAAGVASHGQGHGQAVSVAGQLAAASPRQQPQSSCGTAAAAAASRQQQLWC